MKKVKIALLSISLILFVSFLFFNNINFRFVIENRNMSSFYFVSNEKTIVDTGNDKDEKLMYCENILDNKKGIVCGFYINEKKTKIGD